MILTREDIKDVVEITEVKERFKFDEVIGIKIQKMELVFFIQLRLLGIIPKSIFIISNRELAV